MKQPATKAEAKKQWPKTRSLLVSEARKAFRAREIWGLTANEYPVVVSGDGQWAIGFGKDEQGNVFGFDVFALLPELRRPEEPFWLNGTPKS